MIDKAIARITGEMMKIDDPLAQMIEEHLTERCTNVQVAEKLLASEKSLKELHKQIWDEAGKRKKGNGAYIPDEEIYQMADDYYGIGHSSHETINVLDLL